MAGAIAKEGFVGEIPYAAGGEATSTLAIIPHLVS